MNDVDAETIARLAPQAARDYVEAFTRSGDVLGEFRIDDRLRLCHFFAQILAETGGLKVFRESLNYSAPRLMAVWPRHFPTLAAAEPYAHDEEKLGNFIYGHAVHPDLGNVQPGDGFRYRGRGLLQITGRTAYRLYGRLLDIPLLEEPDLAFDPRYSLKVAAAEFVRGVHHGVGVLELADRDDIVGVTYAVNGGQNGIDQRRFYLARAKQVFATFPHVVPDPATPIVISRSIVGGARAEPP